MSAIFVFITCIINTNGQIRPFCDAGTDELFYENANDFSNWTWDDAGGPDNFYYEYYLPGYSNADLVCYAAPCYAIYAVDLDVNALMKHPTFTSVPISTIDHWNISIIFSVATSQSVWGTIGSCVVSYTVDNGMNFDEIHSEPTNPELLRTPPITRALGTNAENINNVRIQLSTMNTGTDPNNIDAILCLYDEILICGTAITPAPTSNTASPTSNTSPPTDSDESSSDESSSDESSSDEVHSDDSGSSHAHHSSDEIQMYAKQQDQHFIGDDTNNHVYKEKRITISLSSSGVINVMAMFILFACVCIVICVYYNNN